jgi:hypothetical protein
MSETFRLTRRDLDVLSGLGRHRFLTARHLALLHYPSQGVAARRLRQMLAKRLVVDVPAGSRRHERAYALTGVGARALHRARDSPALTTLPDDRRSSLFVNHTLARGDLYVCLELLHRAGELQLLSWRHAADELSSTARVRVDGTLRRVMLVPDAAFVVRARGRDDAFVVEVDMGTVALERMRVRYAAYWRWWRAGGGEALFGSMPLRILTLTAGAGRLERLRRAAASTSDHPTRLFWFASLDEVDVEDPERLLRRVWRTSGLAEATTNHLIASAICASERDPAPDASGASRAGAASVDASSTGRTAPSPVPPAATGA